MGPTGQAGDPGERVRMVSAWLSGLVPASLRGRCPRTCGWRIAPLPTPRGLLLLTPPPDCVRVCGSLGSGRPWQPCTWGRWLRRGSHGGRCARLTEGPAAHVSPTVTSTVRGARGPDLHGNFQGSPSPHSSSLLGIRHPRGRACSGSQGPIPGSSGHRDLSWGPQSKGFTLDSPQV